MASNEPVDRLTTLPTEVQHMIIGYLLRTHDPDKTIPEPNGKTRCAKAKTHPFDCLAATCKALHGEVNAWCRIFLTKHDDITKYKPLKTAKLQAKRSFIRSHGGLLTWMKRHCVFCGKNSSRSAILMNGFRCCASCDHKQWPDKIIKTKEYSKTTGEKWRKEAKAIEENALSCFPNTANLIDFNALSTPEPLSSEHQAAIAEGERFVKWVKEGKFATVPQETTADEGSLLEDELLGGSQDYGEMSEENDALWGSMIADALAARG